MKLSVKLYIILKYYNYFTSKILILFFYIAYIYNKNKKRKKTYYLNNKKPLNANVKLKKKNNPFN